MAVDYFIEPSGNWDIWRMPAEGAGAPMRKQQVTLDEIGRLVPPRRMESGWSFCRFRRERRTRCGDGGFASLMPLPGANIEPANSGIRQGLGARDD